MDLPISLIRDMLAAGENEGSAQRLALICQHHLAELSAKKLALDGEIAATERVLAKLSVSAASGG